ncbi:hypothetical protein Avbf_14047 [Armadillidium vulgare]|nr:hypothetical protein Avbf_14047 [Armadillidium vulgare]
MNFIDLTEILRIFKSFAYEHVIFDKNQSLGTTFSKNGKDSFLKCKKFQNLRRTNSSIYPSFINLSTITCCTIFQK